MIDLSFTDVFKTGVWANMETVQDPHLRELASDLPVLALQAHQSGTVRNYKFGWEKWKIWASQYDEVKVLPADPLYVAIYLLELFRAARTAAPIRLAFYAISWAHRLAGVVDPTLSVLPKLVKEAAPRVLTGFSNKKDPITVSMLSKVVAKYGHLGANIMDLRLAAMCLVSFAGFLRYQELANLRFCDVQFCSGYMKLFLERSKTDVYRDGVWVFVSQVNSSRCPVAMLRRYLSMAGFSGYSEAFIFRGITRHKDVTKRRLKDKNVPLTYSTARSLMLSALVGLGYDGSLFGTHSLRAGGATAAANNSIPDRLFRKHGRWRSDRSKDRYVHEDVRQKLRVSQGLGL